MSQNDYLLTVKGLLFLNLARIIEKLYSTFKLNTNEEN